MIHTCVRAIKQHMESAITTASFNGSVYDNGQKAKEALIRSQRLINLLHDSIKSSLISNGVAPNRIFPPLGAQKPEMKIAGFLKQKDQDVCVVPLSMEPSPRHINWGPLQFEKNNQDAFGQDYSERTLVINVRSQLSSIAKNTDTLFERTFAESVNLHKVYPQMVLGEAYLIPVYEYDDESMVNNTVMFKPQHINIAKYVSFFTALNCRASIHDDISKYEKVTLVIVDFSKTKPKIYSSTEELKRDGLVSQDFSLELSNLSFRSFVPDLLSIYNQRFNI